MKTLTEMIKYDERVKYSLYKDSLGYYTIGVGHLVTKSTNKDTALDILDKKFGRLTKGVITSDEAEDLLLEDIQSTIIGIQNNPTLSKLYNLLDSVRKFALINMCFQLGVSGVVVFKKSLAALLIKDWDEAEKQLKDSLWYRQTTNRAKRVISVFKTGTLNAY
ncbi:glycoside hydrolase family protein [Enterobacter roggenkampii]|uniref:glycoside hydrolase family protein n=1 Tax=Enterobacter roggenkampii TaxID=1812935 RepID=UPI00242BFE70|nr:glycoside hydrolase family protein [Enterobacter roggenkampii]WFX59755.1 glycoside hydrolase family protein [Enterobacter roggenkampii]